MPNAKTDLNNAFKDISQAFVNRSIWMALGWNDVRSRYHRSKLGVFWAGFSTLIFVSALGPIYASLMNVELSDYLMHLLLGFAVWTYISGIITECGRAYTSSAEVLSSFQLTYFTLLLRVVWRNLVVFGYQMGVFVLFVVILQHPLSVNWTIVPLALFIITLNALWMGLIISVITTRFRDLDELLNNIMRLIFFVTPIIWIPQFKSDLAMFADANPFFHLIEVFREPLMSGNISSNSWLVAVVMCVIGWLVAIPLFAKYRSRIAFWL